MTREVAVVAIDLADRRQAVVVTDPDSRVLARRTVKVAAWQLRDTIGWGIEQAAAAGFGSVVVACEPTGHRWRVVDLIAAELGVRLVCVQPMLVARAREAEDFTRNKNDDADAVIIARQTLQLHCYLPERAEPAWARLRHLGARRAHLVVDAGSRRQQVRDLLECAWPAALDAAAQPLDSRNWLAAMTVVLGRVGSGGDLSVIRRLGWARFQSAVRHELTRRGVGWRGVIVRAVFDAATAPGQAGVGVHAHRAGALERVAFAIADLAHLHRETAAVETLMTGVLDDLGLTDLLTSIKGLSLVGAATILAETGDPARFGSARALVKHAGLCPRANESGAYAGATRISRRGRPGLRLAAWRATTNLVLHNDVFAARYQHLTGRAEQRLTAHQARAAVAASLLRQLHAVITTATTWDPDIAAGTRRTGAATGTGAAAAA